MREPITILRAEDEPSLGLIIKESLETRDFRVLLCENGNQAMEVFKKENPQLLVLDVMMPQKDGFTLAKEIRQIDQNIPIIFLTAKSQTQDVVEGFSIGGNDYLKKPFSMEELIVRIHNLLRRQMAQASSQPTQIGKYTFDFTRQTLQYGSGEKIQLTHREAHLLHHLAQNSNTLVERSQILNKLWGNDDFFSGRSMDVFITKLRKKLQEDPSIEIINVRGFGYKLVCN
jgi:DNA-binding response OmpR family regulator